MATYFVFIHCPRTMGFEDHEYCLSSENANSPEGAMQACHYGKPLFAVLQTEVHAVCPKGIGDYENFGPYFAAEAVKRGITISDYYRQKYLPKDAPVVAAKPRKPPPELPPFWWEDPDHPGCSRVKPDAAMAAVRAMCGGMSKET